MDDGKIVGNSSFQSTNTHDYLSQWVEKQKETKMEGQSEDKEIYSVQSVLGRGTFGTVIKCRRESDLKEVALKMINKESQPIEATKAEISVLQKLRGLDPDKCHWVRWYQAFQDRHFTYLEFECLDKSLFDFMKGRGFQPLPLQVSRPIVKQVASAFYHLKALGLIHGDLKPDNIMLVNQREQPYRVKVIDFGLAHQLSKARQGICIQTLPYRAPEVMLALPYTTAVDVWSLGCITAFLYLGKYLYYGQNQYEMLKNIVKTQGLPPDTLLDGGLKSNHYFTKDPCSNQNSWRLKTVQEFYQGAACQFKQNNSVLASLDDILHLRGVSTNEQQAHKDQTSDVHMFVDLLKGMLQLDPAKRLTPRQVVQHTFVRMSHFSMDPPSSYASSSLKRMEVCHHVGREAAQPAKQNPRICSDNGAPVKHHPTFLHPSITSQSATNSQSTSKHLQASHEGERARMEQLRHQRKTSAAWSSSTRAPIHQGAELNSTLPSKRKSPDDLRPEPAKKMQRVSTEPPSSSETLTSLSQSKMTEDTDNYERGQHGTSSTFQLGAKLSSPPPEKKKALEGLEALDPNRKNGKLLQLWKRGADQWTSSSSQPGTRATVHQSDKWRSTLPRKRKSPDDLRPEPAKKMQRISTEPPSSSETLTSLSQSKMTEDIDNYERRNSADQ